MMAEDGKDTNVTTTDAISRQDAINEIESWYDDFDEYDENRGLTKAVSVIRDLPSVKPKRQQGKWLHVDIEPEEEQGGNLKGWMPWYCSECGYGVGKHQTTFCPNCGADMRGEADG